MKSFKTAALALFIAFAGLSTASADSKKPLPAAKAPAAKAPAAKASAAKAQKTATAAQKAAPAPASERKSMSVRHQTQSASARSKLRGDLGLDPTAGLKRQAVLGPKLSRSDRSARMTMFLDKQRTLVLGPKKKVKRPKKTAPIAHEKFEPDALDFMSE